MASAPPIYGNDDPFLEITQNKDVLTTKIELFVSCQNLRDRDLLSKSDPIVILYREVQDISSTKTWKEVSRTEIVKNDLNPKFVKPFLVEYHFEELQRLKFEVYDIDSQKLKLNAHDFLGKVEVNLGSIVGEYGGKVTKTLLHRNNQTTQSTISFVGEEINDNKEIVELQFQAKKLDKKDLFSNSDPFLIFYRHGIESTDYTAVHKTEVIKNTLNPRWKKFTVPVRTLCNGDKHRPIKIECWDFDIGGKHALIGSLQTTLGELLDTKQKFSRELINSKKKAKKKSYKSSGVLQLYFYDYRVEPSFLDYITGGIELCFHVAIDFTASNGHPSQPSSLHFNNLNSPNHYIQALSSVGQICEDYDSDKLIPAYGFGAKINGNVYHDFPLNQSENPFCYGVAGVKDAYYKYLPYADLYGPTNFSPIINLVARQAGLQKIINKYHILLILTDGVISDMDQTKMAIINASKQPLSIIIVGIGNAKFDAMIELDGDEEVLTFREYTAENDIVQFVPYRKFSGSFAGDDLAREVLYEVPAQLKAFMRKKDIVPNPSISKLNQLEKETEENSNSEETNIIPTPFRKISAPPLPSNFTINQSTKSLNICGVTRPGSLDFSYFGRQTPFAPHYVPKEMSAKEFALLALTQHSENSI